MATVPQVDWELAARVGGRFTTPGPALSATEIGAGVAGMRAAAARAAELLGDRGGLTGAGTAPVLIVDRNRWVQANAAMASELFRRVRIAVGEPTPGRTGPMAAALGAQAGAVLGVVSTRIMGQFEGLSADPRLLLVAPNLMGFERRMRVDPADFRLWVCLHEQTHQFQFSHAPWLQEHLLGLVTDFLLAGNDSAQLGRITAVMTYLEGHAETLMDEIGGAEIATAGYLRTLIDRRRQASTLATLLGRVVGLGQKLTQYETGTRFCRVLLAAGGLDLLHRPLGDPAALPTQAEISDPAAWLQRAD